MRTLNLLLALPFILLGCDSPTDKIETTPAPKADSVAKAVALLEVSNPSEFARPDTLISLSLNELGVSAGPLQVWQGDTARPTQLVDDDGDSESDRLLFMADLEAAASHNYTIDRKQGEHNSPPRTHAEVSVKEGGEWQDSSYVGGTFRNVKHVTNPPQYTDHSEYIRYEGPGIESDMVGYRVYLDWRNGFDIFGKKTTDLVLQAVGQDGYDSYHEMSDWGADILKVGQSLGMGGYGYWDGSKTVLVSEVAERSTTIRSDGPIYSSLDIDYKGWNTGATSVDMKATLGMQAGSPMVDVKLATSAPLDNIAIGIVAHPGTELMTGDLDITGEAWSYMASYGAQTLFEDNLGMVVLFKKKDLLKQTRDENSYVLVMKPRGTELQYAFGALWSGQPGGVQSREELEVFLSEELERRTLPPRIRLKTEASRIPGTLDPLEISSRLAKTEMKRRGDSLSYGGWDTVRAGNSSWSYTTGLLMEAMDDLATATGDAEFADFGRNTIDSYLGEDGTIHTYEPEKFNIDHINSGKMLQRLYAREGDPKYRAAIDTLAAQLVDHPRTSEGAFWHKLRYPHQLWLDGVYMGMPFLAGVGVMEGDEHKVEEAAREFIIARSHLRDADTGLYYHAWDEAKEQAWADPETGRSHYVWARGLGWYAMALVDILDVIPADRTELREPLLTIIPELAESLVKTQDSTGVWFQIMDMPDEPGNYREASSSAMFTYFLAKAINKGYLPETLTAVANKAYAGLVSEFISVYTDGSFHLTNICEVGGLGYGRDGSYRYYMSERVVTGDPKGLGPAIMAGVQMSELLK
ncbi:glycoside hydrolase family 88 protein [Pseudomonadota bacterium]